MSSSFYYETFNIGSWIRRTNNDLLDIFAKQVQTPDWIKQPNKMPRSISDILHNPPRAGLSAQWYLKGINIEPEVLEQYLRFDTFWKRIQISDKISDTHGTLGTSALIFIRR